PTPGMQWAVSTDMLVEGRHFVSTVSPQALGHKALAVNLSDLAACGAKPVAFTLSLALPRADDRFVAGLAEGLFAIADAHGIELVGGDTTAGSLTLSITVFGEVPPGQALLRSGARPGDELWVSGTLGGARLGLEALRGAVSLPQREAESARRALERPEPRVALGLALRGVASAAIDLSDGLLGDLGHILERSGVGATIDAASLPCPRAVARLPAAWRWRCVLAGGDDYELLFTASPGQRARVLAAARSAGVPVRCVGRIVAETGLTVREGDGQAMDLRGLASFDHFRGDGV
ncbi:MAG: thiamine monophosphate kinase, partial [Pseudomonadota bacterium]